MLYLNVGACGSEGQIVYDAMLQSVHGNLTSMNEPGETPMISRKATAQGYVFRLLVFPDNFSVLSSDTPASRKRPSRCVRDWVDCHKHGGEVIARADAYSVRKLTRRRGRDESPKRSVVGSGVSNCARA